MKKIYIDMVGDLFHKGHIELLKAARKIGDYVIVGVISDEDASEYKRLPIMTMDERISVIEACKFVDEVIPNAPLVVTSDFLETHKIDLVVHGNDISDEVINGVYGDAVREGKFQTITYTPGISTTDLIHRVQTRSS